MWLYRKILQIPWTAEITIVEVMSSINKKRELLTIIKSFMRQF